MLLFIEKLFLCLSNLKISLLESRSLLDALEMEFFSFDNVHCCAFSHDIVEDEKLPESPEGLREKSFSWLGKLASKVTRLRTSLDF
jgi:hypothetical protein